MPDDTYYVTIRDTGWAVMREGAERASKVLATQQEALDHAKELAGRGGRVMVQNREGKFRKA